MRHDMERGSFITLEGVEGCGKSTQTSLLAAALRADNKKVLTTAEPGGSVLGKELRRILKESAGMRISPFAELFLFLSDRAQHVEEIIRPAIEEGMIVLSDRFTDSTIVYQGYGRGLDLDMLKKLNKLASSDIKPDLTIVLDCDVRVGLERHGKREQESRECRFHMESLDFHDRVRKGYMEMAKQEPGRFRIVDASRAIDEVRESVKNAVKEAGI